MTIKDRDNYFLVMVMWNNLQSWVANGDNELTDKDKAKINAVSKILLDLLVQYGKREGKVALDSIMQGSTKYKFAIIQKDEELPLTNTFEPEILKTAISKVIDENNFNCIMCDKDNFKKCAWFGLQNLLNNAKNRVYKECPYKLDL